MPNGKTCILCKLSPDIALSKYQYCFHKIVQYWKKWAKEKKHKYLHIFHFEIQNAFLRCILEWFQVAYLEDRFKSNKSEKVETKIRLGIERILAKDFTAFYRWAAIGSTDDRQNVQRYKKSFIRADTTECIIIGTYISTPRSISL